ncbi:MAG TPA: hypothetical protein VNB59_03940 [Solirubrobacterales bacterium]|jgi:hypothetical protein|nr:hypothetical protein [Solirubrobacterales bacterium]
MVLVSALAGAGCGGSGSDPGTTVAESTATESHQPVAHGELQFLLAIDDDTEEEEVNTRIGGPYWKSSEGGPTQFDLTVESIGGLHGKSGELHGGLELLRNHAVVEYEGDSYELDPSLLADGSGSAACGRALRRIDDPDRVLKRSGRTVHRSAAGSEPFRWEVSGELDVAAAAAALSRVLRSAACGRQLEATPLPSAALAGIASVSERYRVKTEVTVNREEDGSLGRFFVRLFLYPKSPTEDEYDALLELAVTESQEAQPIPLQSSGLPTSALAKKLGSDRAQAVEAEAEAVASLLQAILGD